MKKKIAVAILGATGMVGQRFVQLLADHPWFEIGFLAASDRSVGKAYGEAVNWLMPTPLPQKISRMIVAPCRPQENVSIVFSALDARVASEIEQQFALSGCAVISNARNHRLDDDVPLLVPEVNRDHLELIEQQRYGEGMIVTNPNCSAIGIAMALKPLHERWGVEAVHVVTLQALSGAGYPGVASLAILDNVIPYIEGEEEKIEREMVKILGDFEHGVVVESSMRLSAQCNRVPVSDGHMACISVKLKERAERVEIIDSWQRFQGLSEELPTAPARPLIYFDDERSPQPKWQRDLEDGMAVSIGRLRTCPLFDWKFVILSHNTIRGAAGGAILNAELLVKSAIFQKREAEIFADCIF